MKRALLLFFTVLSAISALGQDLNLKPGAVIKLWDADKSNYVALKAPAVVTANAIYSWPQADGTAGQALLTDGAGNWYWGSAGGGGGVGVTDGDKGDVVVSGSGSIWTLDYRAAMVNSLLDTVTGGGTAQGTILYRGLTGWLPLAPGTNGQYLKTQGAGANPLWAAVSGTGVTLDENMIAFGSGTNEVTFEAGFEYNSTTNTFKAPNAEFATRVLNNGYYINVPTEITGTVVNTEIEYNTKTFTTVGPHTLTFSPAPGLAGQQWGLEVTNTYGAEITVNIPDSKDASNGDLVTQFTVPANGIRNVYWRFNGTDPVVFLGGAGGATSWGDITSKPDTLSGYGITDAQPLNTNLTSISALAAPLSDKIAFYDVSAGQWQYLTIGTNLSITGTTINAASGGGGSLTWSDLAAGTALTLNTNYYVALGAPRTLTISGSPANGDIIRLQATVTSGPLVLTIPTSYRAGNDGSETSITLANGTHLLTWQYINAKWVLTDSATDAESAYTIYGNWSGSSAAPTFAQPTSAQLAAAVTNETGTDKLVFSDAPAFTNGPSADFWRLLDTGADNYVSVYSDEDLTADRALYIRLNNANRTITVPADMVVAGANYANAWADGVKQTFNPNATNAGVNIGQYAGDPSTLEDGDLWYDQTNARFRARDNGSTVTFMTTRTGVRRTVYVNAGAMIPVTSSTQPQANTTRATNVAYDTLDFDSGDVTNEVAGFWLTLPSAYAGGTVTAKFHWTAASGSGTVIWKIGGRCFADDDAIDQAIGTEQSVTDTLLAAGDVHVTSTTSAITLAGTPASNRPIYFKVTRDSTNDTLAVDTKLLGITIEYAESSTEPAAQ